MEATFYCSVQGEANTVKMSREHLSVSVILWTFMCVMFYNLSLKTCNNECIDLFIHALERNLRFGWKTGILSNKLSNMKISLL